MCNAPLMCCQLTPSNTPVLQGDHFPALGEASRSDVGLGGYLGAQPAPAGGYRAAQYQQPAAAAQQQGLGRQGSGAVGGRPGGQPVSGSSLPATDPNGLLALLRVCIVSELDLFPFEYDK